MCLLPVSSLLHNRHDNILGSHKRKLLSDTPRNDIGVHDQPLRYILQRRQYNIRREKGLGQYNPSVGA